METIITVTAIVLMIAGGMFLIHRLNAQHEERIAAFRYSDSPGGRPDGGAARAGSRPSPEPPVAHRHERHAGSRG